jgi:hypothetical protein
MRRVPTCRPTTTTVTGHVHPTPPSRPRQKLPNRCHLILPVTIETVHVDGLAQEEVEVSAEPVVQAGGDSGAAREVRRSRPELDQFLPSGPCTAREYLAHRYRKGHCDLARF